MATTVTYTVNYTRNLGNYESAKIGYALSSDDIRDGESIEDFRARIKAKVQQWVEEDVKEVDDEASR